MIYYFQAITQKSFRRHEGVYPYCCHVLPCTRLLDLHSERSDIFVSRSLSNLRQILFLCLWIDEGSLFQLTLWLYFCDNGPIDFNYLPSYVIVPDDFNFQTNNLLGSKKTDPQGTAAQTFAINKDLSRIISVFSVSSHQLDRFPLWVARTMTFFQFLSPLMCK